MSLNKFSNVSIKDKRLDEINEIDNIHERTVTCIQLSNLGLSIGIDTDFYTFPTNILLPRVNIKIVIKENIVSIYQGKFRVISSDPCIYNISNSDLRSIYSFFTMTENQWRKYYTTNHQNTNHQNKNTQSGRVIQISGANVDGSKLSPFDPNFLGYYLGMSPPPIPCYVLNIFHSNIMTYMIFLINKNPNRYKTLSSIVEFFETGPGCSPKQHIITIDITTKDVTYDSWGDLQAITRILFMIIFKHTIGFILEQCRILYMKDPTHLSTNKHNLQNNLLIQLDLIWKTIFQPFTKRLFILSCAWPDLKKIIINNKSYFSFDTLSRSGIKNIDILLDRIDEWFKSIDNYQM